MKKMKKHLLKYLPRRLLKQKKREIGCEKGGISCCQATCVLRGGRGYSQDGSSCGGLDWSSRWSGWVCCLFECCLVMTQSVVLLTVR